MVGTTTSRGVAAGEYTISLHSVEGVEAGDVFTIFEGTKRDTATIVTVALNSGKRLRRTTGGGTVTLAEKLTNSYRSAGAVVSVTEPAPTADAMAATIVALEAQALELRAKLKASVQEASQTKDELEIASDAASDAHKALQAEIEDLKESAAAQLQLSRPDAVAEASVDLEPTKISALQGGAVLGALAGAFALLLFVIVIFGAIQFCRDNADTHGKGGVAATLPPPAVAVATAAAIHKADEGTAESGGKAEIEAFLEGISEEIHKRVWPLLLAEVHDVATVMAEHDKHIENAKCGGRDREEINSRYTVGMVFEKRSPGLRRRFLLTNHIFGNCSFRHINSKL